MSSAKLLRRNSSKQGLQNLLRVTAQRSIEDAEEVERERRRRARESFRRASTTPGPGGPTQDNGSPIEDGLYNSDLKPSSSPSLEEDEGFSDWTQRLEKRRQQRKEELSQENEEAANGAAGPSGKTPSVTATAAARLLRQNTEDEEREKDLTQKESERRGKVRQEEAVKEERAQREREREKEAEKRREEQMKVPKKEEEDQRPEVKENRKEVKVSYTSKVFLNQKAKDGSTNGNAPREEVTSQVVKTKRTPSRPVLQAAEAGEADEAEAILETEQRLEKIRRSHQEKESQELEQLRHRQAEAEQELEELKRRREARRGVREEEERRREEEEQQRLAKEEEEKRRMKEDIERRRMEAAERMKTLSTSVVDGDEIFSSLSPKGPTFKRENEEGLTAENTCSITERTESLNRSLKKRNSFKKTQAPVLLSKIDDKLEQYTHAIETSQEAKAAKQALMDLISPPEAVASKKNLFEAGDAWSQSPTKGTPCKDAEGLKVGVADLITQWVKGNPDGSGKQSPTKPSDVRPGDVMQKKNMWEVIGDASSGRPGQQGTRGTPSGKRYKFVVTGHGKYEKFPADDEDGDEYTNDNGKSDLCPGDY